jgi:ferric-dicitrate binding protein FerR (iron transport regulator)
MSGGKLKSCKTRVPKGGSAARTKRRKLFGNAHGRFRTRGRNSSATVRGTVWQMTDTCAGTLTRVSKGSVTVRDFTLRKNKTVKAGKKYFAKAPKKPRRLRK